MDVDTIDAALVLLVDQRTWARDQQEHHALDERIDELLEQRLEAAG